MKYQGAFSLSNIPELLDLDSMSIYIVFDNDNIVMSALYLMFNAIASRGKWITHSLKRLDLLAA